MMARWQWLIAQLTRRLWVHATLIGGLGILAAILAALMDKYIPWQIPGTIHTEAVDSLLTVIASSMLSVTTFSLSIMVSAYGAVTSSVTPRATKLVTEDRLTQNVLSTFIGSFLFSIVGLVVLKTGGYGPRGRVVLFIFTVVIIVLVVIALIRWINHLTRLGRVGVTTDWVENATRRAIEARLAAPYLGGTPLRGPRLPDEIITIPANETGYIAHIDMSALTALAESLDSQIFVTVLPGSFVYPGSPLARVGLTPTEMAETEMLRRVQSAFVIGDERSFDQDPRFGLAVLSEIACRALSAAVNDYGTAIDVIGRSARLLSLWAGGAVATDKVRHPRICVPPLLSEDLFEDAFQSIARDGAALIEVQLRLQKALIALSGMGDSAFQAAARTQSDIAMARAEIALSLSQDKHRLKALFSQTK